MASSPTIDFLLSRHSLPIQLLAEPGPTDAQIRELLQVAAHVPDHGKLAPWRFILYRGEARLRIGDGLVALAEAIEGPLPPERQEKERRRFSFAPLVIGVVSAPKPHPKIPEWEMFLSAGAAATSLLFAAHAMGFGANWLTGWYADLPEGRRLLGLEPQERVAGFVHVGTPKGPVDDRPRPELDGLVSEYAGPAAA